MEAMIDSGQEWMIPLLEYRDWLSGTQDLAVKPEQREFKGRDGRIKITASGTLRWRTYTLDFSREMLRKLLATQAELQRDKPEPERPMSLISLEELREIRRIWQLERQDWQDSLPAIYEAVTGQQVDWEQNDAAMPGQLEAELLAELTAEADVPLRLVQKLLDAEWQHQGMFRRAKIHDQIEKIFREDWRSWEEIEAEMTQRQRGSMTEPREQAGAAA